MISQEYKKQLKKLHGDKSRPNGFGGKIKKLGKFTEFMLVWQPSTVLDYGCGKGHILAYLRETYPNTTFYGYDPAVPMFENIDNTHYDCIFSNDVLEHIEPEYLQSVLEHINSISNKFIWLRIDTLPARKFLSDGRNAHLILETQDWWTNKIKENIKGQIVYNILSAKGKLDIAIEK